MTCPNCGLKCFDRTAGGIADVGLCEPWTNSAKDVTRWAVAAFPFANTQNPIASRSVRGLKPLDETDEQVLEAVIELNAIFSESPSLTEISAYMNKPCCWVRTRLLRLENHGVIERPARKHRAVKVTREHQRRRDRRS